MPVIGVLALQGDVREHVRALEEAGADAMPVRRLAEIEAVDGLVIPGGESTTLWKLATAFELMDPLSKLIKDGLPAFGSCAGMIMLADRLQDGVDGQQTFGARSPRKPLHGAPAVEGARFLAPVRVGDEF